SVADGGVLTINNSTISANAARFDGGGISNQGSVSLYHVTMAGNVAESQGGGLFNGMGNIELYNSLLAENYQGVVLNDCNGPVIVYSSDYNYSQSNCPFGGSPTHNLTGGDPLLGPLQGNGGAAPP